LPKWNESAVDWIPDMARGRVGAAGGMAAILSGVRGSTG
jgi:hypothetical protein